KPVQEGSLLGRDGGTYDSSPTDLSASAGSGPSRQPDHANGGGAGEVMTTNWSSPRRMKTATLGEAPQSKPSTFWHRESVRRMVWAPVGTRNCCREHAEQNL